MNESDSLGVGVSRSDLWKIQIPSYNWRVFCKLWLRHAVTCEMVGDYFGWLFLYNPNQYRDLLPLAALLVFLIQSLGNRFLCARVEEFYEASDEIYVRNALTPKNFGQKFFRKYPLSLQPGCHWKNMTLIL